MERRNLLKTLLATPAVFIPAVKTRLSAAAITPVADLVTQHELRSLIDLRNQVDLAGYKIRRRLENGAALERGHLGISTQGLEPIVGDSDCVSDAGGLEVAPVESLLHVQAAIPPDCRSGLTLA